MNRPRVLTFSVLPLASLPSAPMSGMASGILLSSTVPSALTHSGVGGGGGGEDCAPDAVAAAAPIMRRMFPSRRRPRSVMRSRSAVAGVRVTTQRVHRPPSSFLSLVKDPDRAAEAAHSRPLEEISSRRDADETDQDEAGGEPEHHIPDDGRSTLRRRAVESTAAQAAAVTGQVEPVRAVEPGVRLRRGTFGLHGPPNDAARPRCRSGQPRRAWTTHPTGFGPSRVWMGDGLAPHPELTPTTTRSRKRESQASARYRTPCSASSSAHGANQADPRHGRWRSSLQGAGRSEW